jgi:hypothetical protein
VSFYLICNVWKKTGFSFGLSKNVATFSSPKWIRLVSWSLLCTMILAQSKSVQKKHMPFNKTW